jgi:hypothetical protein
VNIPAILNGSERVLILGFVGVLGALNAVLVSAIVLHSGGNMTAETLANLNVNAFVATTPNGAIP